MTSMAEINKTPEPQPVRPVKSMGRRSFLKTLAVTATAAVAGKYITACGEAPSPVTPDTTTIPPVITPRSTEVPSPAPGWSTEVPKNTEYGQPTLDELEILPGAGGSVREEILHQFEINGYTEQDLKNYEQAAYDFITASGWDKTAVTMEHKINGMAGNLYQWKMIFHTLSGELLWAKFPGGDYNTNPLVIPVGQDGFPYADTSW
jgi:hypothetical protein